MIFVLHFALLAACSVRAYTPIPIVSTDTKRIMDNFMEVAQELQRRDISLRGGTIQSTTTVMNGLTVTNGNITMSTTNGTGYSLCFADGTCQNTAGNYSVFTGTRTRVPESSTSNTTFGPCMTGSTITFTVTRANTPIEIRYDGSVLHDTSQGMAWAPLIDGALPADLSTTRGAIAHTVPGGYCQDVSGAYWILAGLSAGSHSFCLTIANVNGTTTIVNGTTACTSSISSVAYFSARELH